MKSACLTAASTFNRSSLLMPSPQRVNSKYLRAWSMQIWRFLACTAFVKPGSLSEMSVSALRLGHSSLTSRWSSCPLFEMRTWTMFISLLLRARISVESPITVSVSCSEWFFGLFACRSCGAISWTKLCMVLLGTRMPVAVSNSALASW